MFQHDMMLQHAAYFFCLRMKRIFTDISILLVYLFML